MASVRPFGVFVRSRTLPRDGLVHASQIDDQIELSKDDPDDAKIQALTWAAQPGSEVRGRRQNVLGLVLRLACWRSAGRLSNVSGSAKHTWGPVARRTNSIPCSDVADIDAGIRPCVETVERQRRNVTGKTALLVSGGSVAACARQVWVMVVDVEEGPGGMPKLACSMRAMDQESGQPLMSLQEAAQRRDCRSDTRRCIWTPVLSEHVSLSANPAYCPY